MNKFFFFFLLFFFVSSSFVSADSVKLVLANSENLGDTWVNPFSADTNYGTDDDMRIGDFGVTPNNYSSYIKFNITAVPKYSLVTDSYFVMKSSALIASGVECRAYAILNQTWDEEFVTYNNNICDVGYADSTVCNLSNYGVGYGGSDTNISLNVTDIMNDFILLGFENVTFRLTCDTNIQDVKTKEYFISGSRPFLNISYDDRLESSIDFPINGSFFSFNESIELNFSTINSSGLDSCWYSVDSWVNNISLPGCSNSFFNISGGNGVSVGVFVNDSAGNSVVGSVVFNVDLSSPLLENVSLSLTPGSLSVPFTFGYSDLNFDSCFYELLGVGSNTSSVCGSDTFVVPDFGDYTFRLYVNDSAGNVVSVDTVFSLGVAEASGGGSGGGSVIIVLESASNFSASTITGSSGYNIFMLPGQSRSVDVVVKNDGFELITLFLSCEGDCDELVIDSIDAFSLGVGEELLIPVVFVVPDDAVYGDRFVYLLNIESSEQVLGFVTLRNTVSINRFAEFTTIFEKLNPFVDEGRVSGFLPKLLFYVVGIVLVFMLFYYVLFKSDRPLGATLGSLASLFLFLAMVLFDSFFFGWGVV